MASSHSFELLSSRVIGAALAVHQDLGPGFMEATYQNAVCVALGKRQIPFEAQKRVNVYFEEVEVGYHCLDLVIGDEIVVELKSVKQLTEIHYAQIRAYLKASRLKVGLLINFNEPVLKIRRFMN